MFHNDRDQRQPSAPAERDWHEAEEALLVRARELSRDITERVRKVIGTPPPRLPDQPGE